MLSPSAWHVTERFMQTATQAPRAENRPRRRPAARTAGQHALTIRRVCAADAAALSALAVLDSAPPLGDDVLVAEYGRTPVAALDLADDRVVADPFARTEEAVALLRLRAAQLRRSQRTVTSRVRRPFTAVASLLR
jgi:hypothetical protein